MDVRSRFKFSLAEDFVFDRVSEWVKNCQTTKNLVWGWWIFFFRVLCFFSFFFSLLQSWGGSFFDFLGENERRPPLFLPRKPEKRKHAHTTILSQQDGRREKEQSQRHGESPREIKAEDEKRQPRKKPQFVFKRIAIRDQERSAEQTAAEIERFSPTLHSQRNTSQRTEEESQRPRENVLPRERYRVFTPRTVDENLSRVTRTREED